MTPTSNKLVSILVLVSISTLPAFAQLPQYRPGQEYRSLNTGAYEIAIQKNGRVDVALTSGEPVFLNAFPMVWFADKKEPEAIRLDGRYSQRFEVNDALGRGQGMRIRYRNIQWNLYAYPTKPYLAVQVAYINESKKPVQIKQLVPWAIGDPKKGSVALGPNTIDSIMLIDGVDALASPLATRDGTAANMIAVLNPQTERSLIAGFTTQFKAINSVHMKTLDAKDDEIHEFNYMRAINDYDPPITVEPGEVLESEIFYLAVTESDPLLALERYAKAVAVTNRVPVYTEAPPRPLLIENVYSSNEEYQAAVMAIATRVRENIEPTEQVVFVLQRAKHNGFRPNDETFADVANDLRSRGFHVGLAENPFLAAVDSEVARTHPDWLLPDIVPASRDGQSDRVLLDITILGVRDWIAATLQERQATIGFESLWDVDLDVYLGVKTFNAGDTLTKIEVIRTGMTVLRASLGNSTPIILEASSLLPAFPNTHHIEKSEHTSRFFLGPHLGMRYARHAAVANTLSYAEAAVMGIHLIESQSTLDTAWNADTRRSIYFPAVNRSAKPQDLYFSNQPAVWLKRGNVPSGHWILAGINNPTDETQTITLPISNTKVRAQPQFTLFDLEEKSYYGQIQNRVNINVSAHQMRTLVLREFKRVPLLLGTTFPIHDSLIDHINENWDAATDTLTGSISSTHALGTLYFLEAPGYQLESAHVNGSPAPWTRQDTTIILEVTPTPDTPLVWTLKFTRS